MNNTRIVHGGAIALFFVGMVTVGGTRSSADGPPNPMVLQQAPFVLDSTAQQLSAFCAEQARRCDLFAGGVAAVYVDAASTEGPLGDIHRGFSQGGEDFRASFFEEMVPHLRALGARVVRTDPLGLSEYIVPHPDNTCRIAWTNPDRIVEALKAAGAKPLFNFTTCPAAWRDGRGFPVNLEGWSDMVRQAVRHYNLERGDAIEYWELWNEPNHNIRLDEYLVLYRVTAEAVKSVDPSAKVGGPAAASLNMEWLQALCRFCADDDVPLDFLSWHEYTVPPWRYPEQAQEVRNLARKYFDRKLDLVLSEWGIDWREVELNDSEISGAHALTSLFFMRGSELDLPMFFEPRDGWDWKGPDRRFWNRWGLLTNRLDRKAGFHAYALWNQLGETTVAARTSRPQIWCIATRDARGLQVLVWSYPEAVNRPDLPPPPTEHTALEVYVRGIPFARWRALRNLVDSSHSNPRFDLAREELETVETYVGEGSQAVWRFALAPYATTLLRFEEADTKPEERERGIVQLRPQAFEIFGGLAAGVAYTLTTSTAQLVSATGRDGVQTAVDRDTGEWHLRPPVVAAPRYVFLDCTLRDDAGGAHAADVCFLLRPCVGIEPGARVVDAAAPGQPVSLDLRLRNHSPQPLRLAVEPAVPHGMWSVDRMECTVPANARESVVLALRTVACVGENPQSVAGAYDVPVRVALADGTDERTIGEVTYHVGVPGRVAYRESIRIDGILSDWTGVPPIHFRNPRHPEPVTRQGDFEPIGYLAWNRKGLYIAADVVDDEYLQEAVGMNLWQGDSICFGMDLTRNADGLGTYGDDDFEWGVALTRNGLESYKWHAGHGFSGGPFRKIKLAVVVGEGRRRYEIFVPWSELTTTRPQEGHVFGINLSVNDRDRHGGGTQDWGSPLVRFKNPAGLVPVVLAGKNNPSGAW